MVLGSFCASGCPAALYRSVGDDTLEGLGYSGRTRGSADVRWVNWFVICVDFGWCGCSLELDGLTPLDRLLALKGVKVFCNSVKVVVQVGFGCLVMFNESSIYGWLAIDVRVEVLRCLMGTLGIKRNNSSCVLLRPRVNGGSRMSGRS
jgi:hypothetical protein